MNETIKQNLNRAAALIGGKAWGLDKLLPRIYMPSRKDTKVYFAFDDATYTTPEDKVDAVHNLGGARLSICIAECGQHRNWYTSQRVKVVEAMQNPAVALAALMAGEDVLAEQIMKGEPIDDSTAYGLATDHLANDRVDDARKALAPWLAETVTP